MDAIRLRGMGREGRLPYGKVEDARRLAKSRILVSVRVFLTERRHF